MARIANSPPAVCVACAAAKPQKRFIDFEAAFDGPTWREHGVLITVDDLSICEDCIREGADLIAYEPQPMREAELAREEALRELAAWREYAQGLEESYGRRPEPLRRGPGRPRRTAPRPERQAA